MRLDELKHSGIKQLPAIFGCVASAIGQALIKLSVREPSHSRKLADISYGASRSSCALVNVFGFWAVLPGASRGIARQWSDLP